MINRYIELKDFCKTKLDVLFCFVSSDVVYKILNDEKLNYIEKISLEKDINETANYFKIEGNFKYLKKVIAELKNEDKYIEKK
ncbi:hypothetical protein SCLARK_001336 [Spiroplasma clarkii]|uniref:Uncharacterized protein n=1 Tax=Spiroplasma clarkii TaxID=2139 RepID=A0A1Y0L2E8_9MOLU|nr:hypothetical protein SCLARK_001336 [Spiroplasma clarkii]ATX71218.1 hypothetical protein SCLAR_v1c09120 [Spiroplasma clarkii]